MYTAEYKKLFNEVKLCSRGIAAAKRKYKKYPSAYANGYAVQVCKGQKPDLKGRKKDSFNEDLDKWFKEKWVDIGSKVGGKHPECGRDSARNPGRPYPKCVPSAKARNMSASRKRESVKRKRNAGSRSSKT